MLIPCLVNFLMQTHFSRLVLSKLCVTYENRIIFILIQDIYIDSLSIFFPFQKPLLAGYRIFRGYKEVCNAADRLPDVTHTVFIVHGVGGIMDEGTIGRNATIMRDNVSHILTKCFPKFQEQSGQRVEFFPVEWRTNLRLDEGLVDAITPQRILGLRSLLNSTGMDIMYYTSPLFRMEIWNALQHELNKLYEMFTARNPTFEANGGKVSIISHSLGIFK